MFEGFWKIWSKDYLHILQQRHKQQQGCENLSIGELIIIRNNLLPPSKQELGRILKVYPDDNGKVRVAEVKTTSGIYKRDNSIIYLSKLPMSKISSAWWTALFIVLSAAWRAALFTVSFSRMAGGIL